MPQPTKAIISNEQKSGIRKGSNRASTGKVVKVKGCSFVEAIETLMGKAAVMPTVTVKPNAITSPWTITNTGLSSAP